MKHTPTAAKLASLMWLVISVICVLVWSYYSSEWWSPAILVLAIFFFVEAIQHSLFATIIHIKEYTSQ